MPACALEPGKARTKHMKVAHHQRPSARSEEVDLDTCHADGEEAPVGNTIGAWVSGDGHDERTSSQGSQIRAGRYACVWACFALRAVHTGWMQACCMSSWGRAILSLGGRAPKWTKFEQLWRLSICSDGSTSREPYVQNRHGWPCAERRRPSMPSSDRRVEQCTSHVAIVSFSILYFTRFNPRT